MLFRSGKDERQADDATASTILVIDDEEDVAAMARDILEARQYKVLVALNPLKGIEVYQQLGSGIQLLLLDLTMPEMSGKDVVAALQALNPGVKIIITSGYSEEDVIFRIGRAKVAAFIQKPYRLQSLLEKVHSVRA